MLLRQVVDLICAPAIMAEQVAYLRVLIDEYVHFRCVTFPSKPLKPKHHYLCHYAELIKQFGPLIQLWTMRYESKHTYFKQCARKLHNLKNLCVTLAERHQLLQAYLSAGNLLQLSVQVEKGSELYSDDYNEPIKESIDQFDFQPGNTLVATAITLKGTKYRKGMIVLLGSNYEGLEVGRIKLILVHQNSVVY